LAVYGFITISFGPGSDWTVNFGSGSGSGFKSKKFFATQAFFIHTIFLVMEKYQNVFT